MPEYPGLPGYRFQLPALFSPAEYLGRYTKGKMAFVMGIPNLETLFDDAYYKGSKGGIIGAFGALFDRNTLIFVYPMRRDDNPDDIITTENFPVPDHLKYFYAHLLENHKILPVEKYNDANMHIWPADVLAQITKGPGKWQNSIPEAAAKEIINRCMFGFCSKA